MDEGRKSYEKHATYGERTSKDKCLNHHYLR